MAYRTRLPIQVVSTHVKYRNGAILPAMRVAGGVTSGNRHLVQAPAETPQRPGFLAPDHGGRRVCDSIPVHLVHEGPALPCWLVRSPAPQRAIAVQRRCRTGPPELTWPQRSQGGMPQGRRT